MQAQTVLAGSDLQRGEGMSVFRLAPATSEGRAAHGPMGATQHISKCLSHVVICTGGHVTLASCVRLVSADPVQHPCAVQGLKVVGQKLRLPLSQSSPGTL